ncbi:MAG: MMPL family transporter [Azospirillaceae bacterium]|nr:MMPL family transporter [Azospirillaceae bacterium]
MLTALILRIVETSARRAVWIVAVALLATIMIGSYAADHLSIDTDVNKLIAADLPWRQRDAAFDREFPQYTDLLAIVVDGSSPDQVDDAAAALEAKLNQRPDLFTTVRRPDAGTFFEQDGVLFLSTAEIQATLDQVIQAQPMLAALTADPSLRGLLGAMDLFLSGIAQGAADRSVLDVPLTAIADTVQSWRDGQHRQMSWQTLLTGQKPRSEELRRFILVQPRLDFSRLMPGEEASDYVRGAAQVLGLTPDRGVRVRLTGEIALGDEEFETIASGIVLTTLCSVSLIGIILVLALRSWRLIVPMLVTLVMGLTATMGFAAFAVGKLNPISVAFSIMFIGIAIDFSIQFGVRYRDERHRHPEGMDAMRATARNVGTSLLVAALATAAGFLSFTPTAYIGVSQLGLIAGVGMMIAVILNLTVLPALLTLLHPPAEPATVGFGWLVPADRWLLRRRRLVTAGSVLLTLLAIGTSTRLSFDFNPLHLRDPHTESVATLVDLIADPATTPYTIDVLAPSPAEAARLAARIDALPSVFRTIQINNFVPEDQEPKLALIEDAAALLAPTLQPPASTIPPDVPALRLAMTRTAIQLRAVGGAAELRLAAQLDDASSAEPSRIEQLAHAVVGSLPNRLKALRSMLSAQPVTLDTLPAPLRRDWVAADGKARIAVFPKGDSSNNAVLRQFVADVRSVVPDAGGPSISLQESANTVTTAFVRAGIFAVVAITLLLSLLLRRARDVALVVCPLLLACALTTALSAALGLAINFANIIALPLLLGVGTAFNIYYVANWRRGETHPLASATTRAILFSALTTGAAFGSLALSPHPGTASMGELLSLSLAMTLLSTFLVLPAWLGPAPTTTAPAPQTAIAIGTDAAVKGQKIP